MELKELKSVINTPVRRKALKEVLSDKKIKPLALTGLEGSATAFALCNLLDWGKHTIIVASNNDVAGYLYHDLLQLEGASICPYFMFRLYPEGKNATRCSPSSCNRS